MKGDALRFLLRDRAIGYWSSTNSWLDKVNGDFCLTESGLQKVQDRLSGKARAQSVSDDQIFEALSRIKGDLKDIELEEYSYYKREDIVEAQEVPDGDQSPTRSERSANDFIRKGDVKRWVLSNAEGVCEGCGADAPFLTDENSPYLEVHHLKFLANAGSDTVTNTVALCPNCHRRCHHSKDRDNFKEQIYTSIGRLVRE